MFVNIELNDRLSVLNTHGVVRILGNNGDPIPVPTEEIDSIRKILQTRVPFNPFPYLTEGKEVVIIRGPLEGVMGRILQVRGTYRLILSVDLIKRSVSVEVDASDIELA